MTNEQLDLLRKGRFVELVDGGTYTISTANDFETFDLIEIDWDLDSMYFKKEDFDNDFKCILMNGYTNKRFEIYDIIKIATDINLINIIWERK